MQSLIDTFFSSFAPIKSWWGLEGCSSEAKELDVGNVKWVLDHVTKDSAIVSVMDDDGNLEVYEIKRVA